MTHPILTLAAELQVQWDTVIAAIRGAHSTRIQLTAQARTRLGDRGEYLLSDWDTRVRLQEIHRDFRAAVIEAMRDHLAALGHPAEVTASGDAWDWDNAPKFRDFDDGDLDAFFLHELDFATSRSFSALGQYLAAHYTPEVARAAALREAAQRVHTYFSPPTWQWRSVVITERAGCKVISKNLYTGNWELSFGTVNEIRTQLTDIALLLRDGGLTSAMDELNEWPLRQFLERRRYASRDTVVVGAGLKLIFFKDKIEYHFAGHAMDALQIAIATHRVSETQAA